MVRARTVDKKIRVSKSAIRREIRRERLRNSVRNREQDKAIAKLMAEVVKLKKKKSPKRAISEYNLFIRRLIKAGLSFSRAAKQWNSYKKLQLRNKRKPSAYNQFVGSQMRLGKTFKQAVSLWKLAKANKLGGKGKVRARGSAKTVISKLKPKVVRKFVRRAGPKSVVKRVKLKPVLRGSPRKVGEGLSPGFVSSSQLNAAVDSEMRDPHFSRQDLKQVMAPDDEEIAFKIIQTYFIEIARVGFKRKLTLDEIIDAYFYALARVKMKGGVVPKNVVNE